MAWSLPLTAAQIPGALLLERSLDYGPRVRVELAESIVFYAWAVAAVAVGGGVLGVASAALAKAAVGLLVMRSVSPVGLVRPRLSVQPVRALLSFGLRYQAVAVVNVVRDQGVNIVVAAVSGVAALGLWSAAFRLLQVPFLLLDALWRVSYPTMARLVRLDDDVSPVLTRMLRITAVGCGAILAPISACAAPLFVVLLGPSGMTPRTSSSRVRSAFSCRGRCQWRLPATRTPAGMRD